MLAKRLKKLRKERGWSQEKLAVEVDVTYSTLTKIGMSAKHNPTLKTLRKLADAFKISLDDLVGRKRKYL